jgi:nucleotide-binding universal stress UspA family protein
VFGRILVPLDGSDLAEHVLPYVEDLARRLGAEVFFIQAIDVAPSLMAMEPNVGIMVDPKVISEQLDAEAEAAESYLSELAAAWRARGIDAKWFVVRGAAAASVVDFAHAHQVDLIAMSTHGRSGLGRLVFGSVADQVLREAGVPVLLIKPDKGAAGKPAREPR